MINLDNIDMSFEKDMIGIELSEKRWKIIKDALVSYAKSNTHGFNFQSFDDVAELYLDINGVLKLYEQQYDQYKRTERAKRTGHRANK